VPLLQLVSSVPLLTEMLTAHVGKGFTELPLAHTRVIDMSLGRDGVSESLLRQVLAIERPEYESQKQTLNNDVVRLRHRIAREQVRHMLFSSFTECRLQLVLVMTIKLEVVAAWLLFVVFIKISCHAMFRLKDKYNRSDI